MNLILFDDPKIHKSLYPFTLTRPVGSLRLGILTLVEKWSRVLGLTASFNTAAYLSDLFPMKVTGDNLLVNSSVIPDEQIVNSILKLPNGAILENEQHILAVHSGEESIPAPGDLPERGNLKSIYFRHPVKLITRPWDLFLENSNELLRDFILLTSGRQTNNMPDPYTRTYHERNVFIEDGAKIRAAVINAEDGPVYIGKGTLIREGSLICGPAAILEGAELSMGVKIRPNTTIGPYCKVGGEIKNSIIYGYSNKAHDGYLGNSVVGEWCNLGADTNCSNLKNNYSNVGVWDYESDSFQDSGQQFCGTFIGDHSRTSIGTMINTGTVIGVSANIFGAGLTPKFIPSFTWGGHAGSVEYDIDKAIDSAGKMMALRKKIISKKDAVLLRYVYELTRKYRHFEP